MTQYDVIIIGRGPAGLSAALYTARAKLSTLVLGGAASPLQNTVIENYFGFEQPVRGEELLLSGVKQAQRLGVMLREEQVTAIEADDGYLVKTDNGAYRAAAVLLATGQPPRKPAIAGLAALEGSGVSYCTTCDGFFFRGKRVGVLGNGNYAVQEALELLPLAGGEVTIFTNGQPPRFTGEYAAQAARFRIEERPIHALLGEGSLKAIAFEDGETPLDGLFVAIGTASSVDFATKLGVYTQGNGIVADEAGRTNLPGVFAAGDCTGGLRQIAVAVGQGAVAGKSIIGFVREQARTKSAEQQAG